MNTEEEEEAVYKIKKILWPPWATPTEESDHTSAAGYIGILCQDINGPCPLIAILNVLLLRGSLSLPNDAGEITQVSVHGSFYLLRERER